MNDRMKVRMNECMTVVCMSYYLNGNKHIKEKEKKHYQNKVTQSDIFLLWYRTERMDAGMPKPALASSMLMHSCHSWALMD
jgi:hypothetical protein